MTAVIVVPPDVAVACVGLTTQLVPPPETMYVPGVVLPPDNTIPTVGVPPLVVNAVPVMPPVIVVLVVAIADPALLATTVGLTYV